MASDIGGAVAALQAAGEDIDALITAVGKAKFLDEIPGKDRQKLRGEGLAAAPARCQPATVQGVHALLLLQSLMHMPAVPWISRCCCI
jgi:hypothetical protein